MLIYIIVYGLIFISIFVECLVSDKQTKKLVLYFNVLILSLFSGLRWDCGSDWNQYYTCFVTIKSSEMFHYYRYGNQYFEPLFSFMNFGFKYIFGKGAFSILLLFSSFLRYGVWAYVFKRICPYPLIAFAAFLSVDMGFPTARTAVAYALILLSYIFITERNLKKYLCCVLCAFLIHKSTIIFLPMYWIYGRIKMKLAYSLIAYVASISFSVIADKYLPGVGAMLSAYAGDDSMSEQIETYTSWQTNESVAKSLSAYVLSFFWLLLFYWQRTKVKFSKTENDKYDFYLFTYTLSLCLTTAFSLFFTDLTRMALLFNTWAFLISYTFIPLRKMRYIIATILIIFLFYRLNTQIFNSMYKEYYIPYKSILD